MNQTPEPIMQTDKPDPTQKIKQSETIRHPETINYSDDISPADPFYENLCRNNKVFITGVIIEPFSFNHEAYGEKFYAAKIRVHRKSKIMDQIPIIISDHIIDVTEDLTGHTIRILGQFRSYNERCADCCRVRMRLFVIDYVMLRKRRRPIINNDIKLDGYVCRNPVYRRTSGGREIADIMIAVNRNFNKCDYVPCICWGRNARFSRSFEVGAHVRLSGRIQSRSYKKYIGRDLCEDRTAYEVSVCSLERIK